MKQNQKQSEYCAYVVSAGCANNSSCCYHHQISSVKISEPVPEAVMQPKP